MWSFIRAFKSGNPESFISAFVHRYGSNGMYKSLMFGNPSIILMAPDVVRKVLMDEDTFQQGWPDAAIKLAGRKSFIGISNEEHKRLRKVTKAPINGHEALSIYVPNIEANVVSALEKWSQMGRIEFLTELRRLTFRIIMYIFLNSEVEHIMEALEKEFTTINHGFRAICINIPGFAYHEAFKARKRLITTLNGIIKERKKKQETSQGITRNDMLDLLLECEDDEGNKLDNEEIIDTLIGYLNAGHESSAHVTTWATMFLQTHPEDFKKAKEEQERIVKNRPSGQKGLTLKEYRQMEYLSKVVDETLRIVSLSFMTFREAKKDVEFKGYVIPKGWKLLIWYRGIHHNPQNYPQPEEFNPSRWDNYVPKPGVFLPFGAGTRLCPGNDLAKLEISIFLHHFLLKYKLEMENPGCPVTYLPHPHPKDKSPGRIVKVSN
ncbi:hypothetical protein L1987_56871 [Smallanthus sonchifolius]|uniref:Uncharacterized protein n=1 Tax=Smallanthus sonchifolius TaxID=185202 RepID=A0ACB9DB24_9ASTR|nr:hypothetical protein L1987_56871 [Smallanthus sonchifolius]